jgi:hypothetical protein
MFTQEEQQRIEYGGGDQLAAILPGALARRKAEIEREMLNFSASVPNMPLHYAGAQARHAEITKLMSALARLNLEG